MSDVGEKSIEGDFIEFGRGFRLTKPDRSYGDDRESRENNYRPRGSDGPPRGGYRGYRSPPRRERTPPAYRDARPPRDDRRRSRSPPSISGGGGYRARPRSPPRRGFSPRRDTRPRSPPRGPRRYSRSPIRARSPLPPRRDPSPYDRRPRSPLPSKRPHSPRDRMEDRRGYSPPRQPRPRFPNENNYRPGEITRSPPPRREEQRSRIPSPLSSRRSSPPIHPDRLAQAGSRSPGYRRPPPPGPRGSGYRERSPPPSRSYPLEEPLATKQRAPLRDEDYTNGAAPAQQANNLRNGDSRPPPHGPSSYNASYNREQPARAPPSEPLSMSAHNRPSSSAVLSAPTQPRGGRGGPAFARSDSRDQPYSGTAPGRGGRPPPIAPFHARDASSSRESRTAPSTDYVPNGPRSSYSRGNPTYDGPAPYAPPFRQNNSSSTTYPRTQRFNTTNHLASLPAIVPGGKLLPSMDPTSDKKLAQLEEESKRLREMIEEKQKIKRQMLRDWESRERESRRDGLRSELAEAQLEQLSGEQIGGAAF